MNKIKALLSTVASVALSPIRGQVNELASVKSSAIKNLNYDSMILNVEFTNGDKFYHTNVPKSTYQELLAAESKGSFYNARIRNRYSAFRR